MSNRTAYITLAILLLNVAITYVLEKHFTSAPLNTKIALNSSTHETYTVFIPMRQTYSVELHFAREGKDFKYLQETLGPMTHPGKKGLPLVIEWSLSKREQTLKSNIITSTDSCGWSNTHVYRCLGSFLVPRGEYIFKINQINVDTELAKFNTSISINYNFKNAHTWQTAYIFWGWLFNLFIAPIISIIVLIFTCKVI